MSENLTEEKLAIEFPKILKGKKALVSGVANKRSIAWGIAQALHAAGAEVIFSYQSERLKPEVEKTLEGVIENATLVELDVGNDESLDKAFEAVAKKVNGKLDIMVHCLAFAPRETLQGGYVDTLREHYQIAQDVSSYSLAAMARKARPLMQAAGGGSIITLTYLGAEKVVPNYNMMGIAKAALEAGTRYLAADLGADNIRVNAISAGPVKTLAARGIADFTTMLNKHAQTAPLKRNVLLEEIGGTALFLASPLSGAITGEVIHVDCGYSIMAM
jgi:enoyl-[acyl-carrier protein] reductase I